MKLSNLRGYPQAIVDKRWKPIPKITDKIIGRFLKKILLCGGHAFWVGDPYRLDAYGSLFINGQRYRAHRVSYFIHTGVDPKDLCVLHKCDEKRCVLPEHLFLGTRTDNAKDRDQKGRTWNGGGLKGEKHGRSKLSEREVVRIRKQYKTKKNSRKEMADKHGLSLGGLDKIIYGQTWKHI